MDEVGIQILHPRIVSYWCFGERTGVKTKISGKTKQKTKNKKNVLLEVRVGVWVRARGLLSILLFFAALVAMEVEAAVVVGSAAGVGSAAEEAVVEAGVDVGPKVADRTGATCSRSPTAPLLSSR